MSHAVQDLPTLVRAAAARHADRIAIRCEPNPVSFVQFDRDSDRVAAWLTAAGVARGERVALYCPNCAEFAIAYFGILKAGATVVPLNLLLNPKEVEYIVADAGVKALLYHPVMADKVRALDDAGDSIALRACIGPDPAIAGDTAWPALLATAEPAPQLDLDPAEDVAVILYTSGTTGHPKGAMLTHGNLAADAASVMEFLDLTPGHDALLVVLPMFHAFAATVGMLLPLLHGLSFVPVPRFEPGLVAEAIDASSATIFLGVPSMYNVLLHLSDEAAAKLAPLRFCVSGGAAMPVEVMRRFEERFGIPVYEGDGPTECGPVTCVNPIGGVRKSASVGLPIPRVEMKILDDAGQELPRNENGEICVRGPNVMKGYWNRPEETAESFFGDWFRTGDIGHQDDDGYFFIVDRKKDMIIVNGMNVYPRVIEEVLYRFPPLREAAVVGEPHALHGEIPVAFVSLKEGMQADSVAVKEWCREHLGRHEIPRKIFFLDELPKNATGKILKRELRLSGELERGVDSRREP